MRSIVFALLAAGGASGCGDAALTGNGQKTPAKEKRVHAADQSARDAQDPPQPAQSDEPALGRTSRVNPPTPPPAGTTTAQDAVTEGASGTTTEPPRTEAGLRFGWFTPGQDVWAFPVASISARVCVTGPLRVSGGRMTATAGGDVTFAATWLERCGWTISAQARAADGRVRSSGTAAPSGLTLPVSAGDELVATFDGGAATCDLTVNGGPGATFASTDESFVAVREGCEH